MSKYGKVLIAGISAATTVCAPTFADDTTEILNGQVNLDAAISVNATGSTGEAAAATLTAVGMANAVSIDVVTPHDIQNDQTFSGVVSVSATTDVDIITGSAVTTSSSIGNSGSIIVDDGMDVVSQQSAQDGSSVTAAAQLNVSDYSMTSVTTAAASANAMETIAYGGETNLDLRQDSGASVTANAFANAPIAGLGDAAMILGASNGNSIAVEGYTGPSQIVDVDQDNRGNILATARVDAGGGAVMTQAAASANGNSARIQNEYGYAHMQGTQDNSGQVDAQAEIIVGNFDIDMMSVSADGVGNSAVVSNIGSDAFMGLTQTNTGGVNATANFLGDAGGSAAASATTFGNAATTYICSECPVTAYGDMNQLNSGAISSVVTGQINSGGVLTGTATAIGNSASYQTITPYSQE
ncbi:MAG: holdfast anchor protein HfaD [Maricaulis sp.]|nr:holdfast anchor protein HfaD [Maricaulis sp.]MDG2044194.1 holdfast anchor protein HfaD [Maricaulis sp.]